MSIQRKLDIRISLLLGIVCVSSGLVLLPGKLKAQEADRIQKCQDAQGRWHYGRDVLSLCGGKPRSRSELLPSGVVLDSGGNDSADEQGGQANVPKPDSLEQAADRRWLMRYTGEQAIIDERDRKLDELERAKRTAYTVREELMRDIRRLQSRRQTKEVKMAVAKREYTVDAYTSEIQRLQAERQWVKEDYQHRLERFRLALVRSDLQ